MMKYTFAIILLTLSLNLHSKTVYCSSSRGNDTFPGTISAPVSTVKKAIGMGDTILLCRGDVFFEPIVAKKRVFGAYGTGANPTISGLKIPAKGVKWQRGRIVNGTWKKGSSGNVWRMNLSQANKNYKGVVTNGSSWLNNVGAIISLDGNIQLSSKKCEKISDLADDFDFWQMCPDPSNGQPADFDYIYLYSSINPGKMNLGFTVGSNGVEISDGSLCDIDIKYWGRHGIAAGSNLEIKNCNIDRIGGMIQRNYSPWTCLGNGIEIWCADGAGNVTVSNCHVSHCFDAGITLQGIYSNQDIKVSDIVFEDNVISNCCQGWEDFYRDSNRNSPLKFIDCYVRRNRFIDNGINTGFRYYSPRFKYCQVLGNSTSPTDMRIVDNIFINGNFRCCSKTTDGLYNPQYFSGNEVYIVRGQYLIGNYIGSADVVYVPTIVPAGQNLYGATEAAIEKYRTLTGDYNTRFTVFDSTDNPELTRLRTAAFNINV